MQKIDLSVIGIPLRLRHGIGGENQHRNIQGQNQQGQQHAAAP